VVHSTALNISGNIPSYPPDNHHSSDGVYWRAGGRQPRGEQYTGWDQAYFFGPRWAKEVSLIIFAITLSTASASQFSQFWAHPPKLEETGNREIYTDNMVCVTALPCTLQTRLVVTWTSIKHSNWWSCCQTSGVCRSTRHCLI